jgi:hypothetical protein
MDRLAIDRLDALLDRKRLERTCGCLGKRRNPIIGAKLPVRLLASYWYLLHLVLVVEGRRRIGDFQFLGELFEICQAIALERDYLLGGISVMPDHLNMCLRGALEDSPEAIAIAYMNESCRKLGVVGLWRPSYYVGTTGAYSMNAVRGRTPWASDGTSPSGSQSS